MIENRDIQQGAITATKLSKNLRLPLANVAAGTAGQVPVVQSNGDLAYKAIGGAVTIDSDGLTEMSLTTDTMPEGAGNLYYTDARVDARIRQIKNEADQQATSEEPGFMPKEDKAKLDATPPASSAVRKYTTVITGTAATDGVVNSVVEVTHNLGTYYVFVSVRHPAYPYVTSSATSVEDKFDEDWYTQMDGGLDGQTGFQAATVDASYNLSDMKVLINFPIGMVEDDEYLVTIIG
jgi:hypothetical protein